MLHRSRPHGLVQCREAKKIRVRFARDDKAKRDVFMKSGFGAASSLSCNRHPPLVISTGAKRSGEISVLTLLLGDVLELRGPHRLCRDQFE